MLWFDAPHFSERSDLKAAFTSDTPMSNVHRAVVEEVGGRRAIGLAVEAGRDEFVGHFVVRVTLHGYDLLRIYVGGGFVRLGQLHEAIA